MFSIRNSLVYFLIFTVIASLLTYKIVVRAYATFEDQDAGIVLDSRLR